MPSSVGGPYGTVSDLAASFGSDRGASTEQDPPCRSKRKVGRTARVSRMSETRAGQSGPRYSDTAGRCSTPRRSRPADPGTGGRGRDCSGYSALLSATPPVDVRCAQGGGLDSSRRLRARVPQLSSAGAGSTRPSIGRGQGRRLGLPRLPSGASSTDNSGSLREPSNTACHGRRRPSVRRDVWAETRSVPLSEQAGQREHARIGRLRAFVARTACRLRTPFASRRPSRPGHS